MLLGRTVEDTGYLAASPGLTGHTSDPTVAADLSRGDGLNELQDLAGEFLHGSNPRDSSEGSPEP